MTDQWIRHVLGMDVACPVARILQLRLDGPAFCALVPLLRHGAIDVDQDTVPGPGLAARLERSFCVPNIRCFVADAQRLADDTSLVIRDTDVYLRTENPLTSRFMPPVSAEVGAAMGHALRSIDAALRRAGREASQAVISALIGSHVLLTIHPFRDGNGRTARMFFAAQVLRHVGPAPTALLGILLMQRSGAHQYHQACWALRAGDPEPIVSLFLDSERLAAECLARSSTAGLPPAELRNYCRLELQRLSYQCGTISGRASNLRG